MIPEIIEHQTQPTYNSCVSTCLAMLLGMTAEEVIEEFHDKYQECCLTNNPLEYLLSKGVEAEWCHVNEALEWGYIYALSVPSLNYKAINHYVILDCRETGNTKLYDPAMGREGKMWYELMPDHRGFEYDSEGGEWPLKGYHPEIKIRG